MGSIDTIDAMLNPFPSGFSIISFLFFPFLWIRTGCLAGWVGLDDLAGSCELDLLDDAINLK